MTDLFYIFVALALVALNAFFVATEFAIVKVRGTRIQELVSDGVARAEAVQEVIENLNPYLSACQLGITLASLGLGWVGEPAFAHVVEPLFGFLGENSWIAAHTLAVSIAFVLITLLHVVLGELVPKALAIDYPERTAFLIAWPIRLFYRMFYPFIWAMNELSLVIVRLMGLKPKGKEARVHTEEELRLIVARSQRGGVLSEEHARLLSRTLDFADHTQRCLHGTQVGLGYDKAKVALPYFGDFDRPTDRTRRGFGSGGCRVVLALVSERWARQAKDQRKAEEERSHSVPPGLRSPFRWGLVPLPERDGRICGTAMEP